MTADATLQHLYHFCNHLPHRPYVDFRPYFSYQEDSSGLIGATVTLPNCLSAHVRHAASQRKWQTERVAKKDAAFQAYSALYEAALLNDNLLPLCHDWNPDQDDDLDEGRVGLTDISPQIDIWYEMGVEKAGLKWHETAVTVIPPDILRKDGETDVRFLLTTPGRLHPVPPLSLNWDSERTFIVKVGRSVPVPQPDDHGLKLLRDATMLFYTSVRSERLACCSNDFLTLFAPYLKYEGLAKWLQTNIQRSKASSIVGTSPKSLVRVPYPNNPPYIFRAWLESEEGDVVECERLPRRRNFRSPAVPKATGGPPASSGLSKESRLETFSADECTFDGLPLPMARIGLFMPEILQHIVEFTISDRVKSGLLKRVPFQSREHIITAICAPSARRQTDYQRFEFLGDSILKYVVSCHLFVSQPDWHEGLLTLKRSQLVSNANLAGAATRNDLSPYIITEGISYKDWTAPVFPSAHHVQENRHVSSKTLADVVEALIGAAWADSGMSAAMKCINVFLPAIPPVPTNFATLTIPEEVPFGTANEVESLIRYTFNNPILLLEALTHPSCGGHSRTDSYQRLEYLGDAVLDMLIADDMATRLDRLSQGRMTQVKAALVNARLLGFLCLDLRRLGTHGAVQTDAVGRTTATTSTREVHLATFMRTASSELAAAQHASQARYALHQDDIRRQLDGGKQYPWMELLRLRPDKFYSDIVESVLGAIFVDAGGSLLPCAAFIETLGLRAYIDRLIDEVVDVSHPRERVQRWAGARTVTYDVQRNEVDGRFQCSLLVDKVMVAEVYGCCDREEAITRVASQVEKMLSSGDTVL